MNIVLDINSVDIKNILFLDSKKNIIVNGKFTRLIYSNSLLTMSGLYINFPINLQYINNESNLFNISRINNSSDDYFGGLDNDSQSLKNIIFFNNNNPTNINILKQICELEYKLLNYYKAEFLSSSIENFKTFSLILNKQLSIGKIKLYKEIISPSSQYIQSASFPFNSVSNNFISPPPGFSNINNFKSCKNLSKNSLDEKNKTIKFYQQNNSNNLLNIQKKNFIILKISGIWETKNEIGLTYKFLEMTSL